MKVYIGDVKKEVGWTSKESLRKTFPPLSFGNEKPLCSAGSGRFNSN